MMTEWKITVHYQPASHVTPKYTPWSTQQVRLLTPPLPVSPPIFLSCANMILLTKPGNCYNFPPRTAKRFHTFSAQPVIIILVRFFIIWIWVKSSWIDEHISCWFGRAVAAVSVLYHDVLYGTLWGFILLWLHVPQLWIKLTGGTYTCILYESVLQRTILFRTFYFLLGTYN